MDNRLVLPYGRKMIILEIYLSRWNNIQLYKKVYMPSYYQHMTGNVSIIYRPIKMLTIPKTCIVF